MKYTDLIPGRWYYSTYNTGYYFRFLNYEKSYGGVNKAWFDYRYYPDGDEGIKKIRDYVSNSDLIEKCVEIDIYDLRDFVREHKELLFTEPEIY